MERVARAALSLAIIVGSGLLAAPAAEAQKVPAPTPPSGPFVQITAGGYNPSQVTIPVGASILFTNLDANVHTATADDNSWDTGGLGPGQSKSITFNNQGFITFHSATDLVYGSPGTTAAQPYTYQLQGQITVGPPGTQASGVWDPNLANQAQGAPTPAPAAPAPTPVVSKNPDGSLAVSGNDTAQSAAPLLAQPLGGKLIASTGAAYAYFSMPYKPYMDGGKPQAALISLRFSPSDPLVVTKVGFNVYDESGTQIAQGAPARGGTPDAPNGSDLTRVKNTYVSLNRAATLTIQVFSYHDQDVTYTVQAYYKP